MYPHHDDIRGLILLIKAAILQNLGGEKHYEEAFNDLQIVINECDAEEDTFIHPFAYLSKKRVIIKKYKMTMTRRDIMN